MRRWALLLALGCCVVAGAKDKKKVILPDDVLEARTALVVIDPDAGTPAEAPLGNSKVRDSVERALMNWGRFELVSDVSTADLVISIRKGSGKLAQETIGGVPVDRRPGVYQPSDAGGRVGMSTGTPPMAGDPTGMPGERPTPRLEVGGNEDLFAVYRGRRDNALDASPVWRMQEKDALRTPDLPAVDAFRKAVLEAEKQRAARP
ncbi:hypothetical protein DYQ86_19670 [Acidobacteria bacterium AB60]|nr:hypothetical protein DYQ86_19670 [Acidobacteria bacterium AB60]